MFAAIELRADGGVATGKTGSDSKSCEGPRLALGNICHDFTTFKLLFSMLSLMRLLHVLSHLLPKPEFYAMC
jgi:hypothetical protein